MDHLTLGVVGAGWMGQVHARACQRLPHHFPDLPQVRVVAVSDPVETATEDFVNRYGDVVVYADWHDLIDDPSIDIVSVAAPNALHGEIGAAVAAAGKHLWIEKPVGLTAADAQRVSDAVAANGTKAAIGFNYRNVPAVAKAKHLIEQGAIGTLTHARVQLFTDYAAHPGGPLGWRYTLESGGHGVLGDLTSHGVDMIRFLIGDFAELVADTAVFIPERPTTTPGSSHYAFVEITPDTPLGPVENEDYVAALVHTVNNVRVILESSRTAVGDQNNYGFEIHGTAGLLRWDFRRSDELEISTGSNYQSQPTTTIYTGPGDGQYGAFQPGAGIAMSFDDTKVIELAHFVADIRDGGNRRASERDAVASAQALEAIVTSAATRTWIPLR
jgi:predicted dehydrogenase